MYPEEILGQILPEIDGNHVVELGQLKFDLLKPWRAGDEEQHTAFGAVADRRAANGLEVKGPARKEPGDMRHRSGMIADREVENDG